MTDGVVNQLSLEEAERLSLIAEECSEVIKAIMKIQRHGYSSTPPTGGLDNRHRLEQEVGDLMATLNLAEHRGDIRYHKVMDAIEAKYLSAEPYLHHNTMADLGPVKRKTY